VKECTSFNTTCQSNFREAVRAWKIKSWGFNIYGGMLGKVV